MPYRDTIEDTYALLADAVFAAMVRAMSAARHRKRKAALGLPS
jgi:hypothetical protein